MVPTFKLTRPVTTPEDRKRNAERSRQMLARFCEAQSQIDEHYRKLGKKAPEMIASVA